MATLRIAWLPLLLLPAGVVRADPLRYEDDVRFALEAIEAQCGPLLAAKGVEWSAVRRDTLAALPAIDSPAALRAALVRLMARLRDGQATVRPTDRSRGLRVADEPEQRVGPGLRLCRSGSILLVKNSWAGAARAGVVPGMALMAVDGRPASSWLATRMDAEASRRGFSTPQQALFHACHAGLAELPGTQWKIVLADRAGRRHRRTVLFERAGLLPEGPAFPPGALEGGRDLRWGRTPGGCGYVHLRRGSAGAPYRLEDALCDLAGAPGLVLDLRANTGSTFDDDALLGRLVPAGRTVVGPTGERIESRGAVHYGGPLVVLVDGTVRGMAEVAAARLRASGRALLLGESPTAGSCARRATIALPSGLFELWVSTRSLLPSVHGGQGIEGVGVKPQETVALEAVDLEAGVDTLIRRADEQLAAPGGLPVPYVPSAFGWGVPATPRGG